ncbi:MAG: YIP1 family protein [Terracidiphilus sp.]|jgi:uncharacterized membrane protein
MSDPVVQPVAGTVSGGPGLSQMQRVICTFTAPSKTFEDIKRGNKSWWLPFVIMFLTFAVFFGAVTSKVTWKQVAENEQKKMPEFARHMIENMPPEQRARQEQQAPITQEITAVLAPFGVLLLDLVAAGVLLGTINFVFGGKARFGSLFAVTLYAGLVLWPLRWLLAAVTIFAGMDPEAFNIHNSAPTNVASFFPELQSHLAVYGLLTAIDALSIWCMIVTSIGVATVAGVKRSSGYFTVFGWWVIGILIGVGIAAAMG